jgi:cbb3-type cytochrome oxidase maturation protein
MSSSGSRAVGRHRKDSLTIKQHVYLALALALGGLALAALMWALKTSQFDDLYGGRSARTI